MTYTAEKMPLKREWALFQTGRHWNSTGRSDCDSTTLVQAAHFARKVGRLIFK